MKRRVFGFIVRIGLGLFLTANLLAIFAPFDGYDLVLLELITGFWFFLSRNLPSMSWDVGTWGPGLGAFLLATVFSHRFLARWAARTNRHWNFGTSLCLALMVPVLFVISFIVPGVLLQLEVLRQVPWFEG